MIGGYLPGEYGTVKADKAGVRTIKKNKVYYIYLTEQELSPVTGRIVLVKLSFYLDNLSMAMTIMIIVITNSLFSILFHPLLY